MALLLLGSVVLGLFIAWIFARPYLSPLRHIPGPRYYPLIGAMPSINLEKYHENLLEFHQTYGPVVRVVLPHEEIIAISGYEEIRKVLITSGMAFGGRPANFRFEWIFQNTGVILNRKPDSTWKALRNISQKHIKQFGDGLSRIEELAAASGGSMFQIFRSQNDIDFDPHDAIFDAALMNIGYLITGVFYKPGHPFIENMRTLERSVQEYLATAVKLKYAIYDILPSVRHLRLSGWCDIQQLTRLIDEVSSDVRNACQEGSFADTIFSQVNDPSLKPSEQITAIDAKMTIVSLLFAGAATTSATFHACLNILAHKSDIQQKILDELSVVCEKGKVVTLAHRNKMPYTRAFLLELLRYITTSPLTVPHMLLEEDTLNGHVIPENTVIHINLWGMHNDPEFWKNPLEFQPERFLDEDGEVLSADHPNRQHLMPFGAGTRVCLGQAMAMARLFMWIAMVVQQFNIVPADGNSPENIESSKFILRGLTRVPRYKVIFQPRKVE